MSQHTSWTETQNLISPILSLLSKKNSTGERIQAHARQTLYNWATATAPSLADPFWENMSSSLERLLLYNLPSLKHFITTPQNCKMGKPALWQRVRHNDFPSAVTSWVPPPHRRPLCWTHSKGSDKRRKIYLCSLTPALKHSKCKWGHKEVKRCLNPLQRSSLWIEG